LNVKQKANSYPRYYPAPLFRH